MSRSRLEDESKVHSIPRMVASPVGQGVLEHRRVDHRRAAQSRDCRHAVGIGGSLHAGDHVQTPTVDQQVEPVAKVELEQARHVAAHEPHRHTVPPRLVHGASDELDAQSRRQALGRGQETLSV